MADLQTREEDEVPTRSNTASKQRPRYAANTTAATLPEYANAEAEAIRQSFSVGNYRMISHLPTELRPHHVSDATLSRIDDNITSAYFVAPHGTYRRFGGKDVLFSTFDYQPDEYALASQLASAERRREEEKRLRVNPLPFLPATPRPQVLGQLAGSASYDENAKYVDSYESAEEVARRQAYLQAQKVLHGPFVPSQAARSIGDDRIIRLKLPDIVGELMRQLDADWGDAQFQIYADPDELIIVQFNADSVDNADGLLAYMNLFVKTNPVVSKYALSKLVELWSHRAPDGFLYYAFRPPWVRRRADESFNTLHPEAAAPATKKDTGDDKRATLRAGMGEASSTRASLPPAAAAASAAASSSSSSLAGGSAASGASSSSSAAPAPVSSGLSAEEREQMAQLMASFDAGLQLQRKPNSAAATGGAK